jgi:hypothetical protein
MSTFHDFISPFAWHISGFDPFCSLDDSIALTHILHLKPVLFAYCAGSKGKRSTIQVYRSFDAEKESRNPAGPIFVSIVMSTASHSFLSNICLYDRP